MSFASAVDHLHALGHELAAPDAPRRKFDLDHMRILARALGDPQQQFPAILIAGTNGKGSTAATLAAILAAAGYRTGLYTSPHLTRVTERIRIADREQGTENREQKAFSRPDPCSLPLPDPCPLIPVPRLTEIPEPDFARLYFRVDDAARQLVSSAQLPHHPSFFETLTAIAFLYFAGEKSDVATREPVDIAILEVGMGGRLDATNIVHPILSVITDIALDHQEYLGPTISAIAREKAGILRENGTLITLPQHPEANQAIGEAAIALNVRGINAAGYLPGRTGNREQGSRISHATIGPAGPRSPLPVPCPLPLNHYDLNLNGEPLRVRSPLAGEHQRRNLALAIAAAIELRNHKCYNITNSPADAQISHSEPLEAEPSPDPSSTDSLQPATCNFTIANAAIEAGIAHTSWPGRLEFLPPNLLLDVAHNPAGAWTLRAAIATLAEDQPRTLIFSCLRDKDLTEMAQILFPLFDSSEPPAPPKNPVISPSEPPAPPNNSVISPSEPSAPPNNSVISTEASQLHRDAQRRDPRIRSSNPPTHHLILIPIANPRAASLDDLLAAAARLSIPAHPAHDPAEAFALARSLTPANGLILATGSIYLIGAIRAAALP